jgi:sugar lactone lactonase YvrE
MRRLAPLIALFTLLSLLALAPAVSARSAHTFPDQIQLPNGFAPEGIAIGRGATFYTGSLAGAGIWRGNLRTGDGDFLVTGGGPFVGMKVDRLDRLWVAGGPAGNGYVFDATTGATLATFSFASAGTFVNDVVVTRDAAWFTESMRPVLYRVAIGPSGAIGDVTTLDLTGQVASTPGAFGLNGIDATPNGKTLITVNSTAGELYAVDVASGTATTIDLGGATVTNGDGILLHGRTLHVVRNQNNVVAVIRLSRDLTHGTLLRTVTSDDFDVPTTLGRFGGSVYAINARFTTPVTPETEYWVTRLSR